MAAVKIISVATSGALRPTNTPDLRFCKRIIIPIRQARPTSVTDNPGEEVYFHGLEDVIIHGDRCRTRIRLTDDRFELASPPPAPCRRAGRSISRYFCPVDSVVSSACCLLYQCSVLGSMNFPAPCLLDDHTEAKTITEPIQTPIHISFMGSRGRCHSGRMLQFASKADCCATIAERVMHVRHRPPLARKLSFHPAFQCC